MCSHINKVPYSTSLIIGLLFLFSPPTLPLATHVCVPAADGHTRHRSADLWDLHPVARGDEPGHSAGETEAPLLPACDGTDTPSSCQWKQGFLCRTRE